MKIIKTQDYTLRLIAKDFVLRQYMNEYRDKTRFLALCKECPNYARSWSCPPFLFDTDEILTQYSRVHIIVSQFIPLQSGLSIDVFREMIKPACVELEKHLLTVESEVQGHVFATIGKCLHCGDQECRRISNQRCLHPDKVRPSLEAYGFDLSRTVNELFGIELKWGKNSEMPDYIVLVTGMLHNNANGISIIR